MGINGDLGLIRFEKGNVNGGNRQVKFVISNDSSERYMVLRTLMGELM
jgi:hypothetical protein